MSQRILGINMLKQIILLLLVLTLLTSCAMFNSKGTSTHKEETGRARIVKVESHLSQNLTDKMELIAGLSYGTDYALSKINPPPLEVMVARDINQRVVSLAGSPTIERMKEMQDTIDKLTSKLVSEQTKGKLLLAEKDTQISNLQKETKQLNVTKELEVRKYMSLAQATAGALDHSQVQLDQMDSWLGLGAVWYGIKRFIISSLWILGIGGILFLILRMVAMSNPIAASIFSLFATIASWFIRGIELLIPKAVAAAGHTTNQVFNVYKSTLWKLVDAIQLSKTTSKVTGSTPTIHEVLDEVSKSMNEEEKQIVKEIKRALQWN
jgi:hypothetical protein